MASDVTMAAAALYRNRQVALNVQLLAMMMPDGRSRGAELGTAVAKTIEIAKTLGICDEEELCRAIDEAMAFAFDKLGDRIVTSGMPLSLSMEMLPAFQKATRDTSA